MGQLSEHSLVLLHHFNVHGPQTIGEVVKAYPTTQRQVSLKTMHNLAKCGHLAQDRSTKEPTFCITGRGRERLLGNVTPRRARGASQKAEPCTATASAPGMAAPAPYRPSPSQPHIPLALADHDRPGASNHATCPSRIGNRLHWRDGRITDLDGTLLLDAQGQPLSTAAPAGYRPLNRSL